MHVSDDEKAILAPAVRRAGAILLHWQGGQNLEGIRCVLNEVSGDSEQVMDVTLALLLLQDDCIREHLSPSLLLHMVHRAALKENI